MDMNDPRAPRDRLLAGWRRQRLSARGRFDITVASEIMAILCLSTSIADLERRIGQIVVAYKKDKSPVYARDLKAAGAMVVLLKDALQPNLVQTLENNPAFVHGGPFANIAHGCNSVMATKPPSSLPTSSSPKRASSRRPWPRSSSTSSAARPASRLPRPVIVATIRALKMHGGVAKEDLKKENVEAQERAAPTSAATSRT